jgi:hypothetical protein
MMKPQRVSAIHNFLEQHPDLLAEAMMGVQSRTSH